MIRFSWQTVVVLLGITALLMGLMFSRFGRGGDFPGMAPSFASFKLFFSEPLFWVILLLFGLGISASLGVYAMLPLYLISERGIERAWANSLVALSRVSGLGMTLVGGWITDWIGAKKTLIGVFMLTGILTVLIGVTSGTWILIAVFLQPMLAICFFPAGFSALSRIGPPNARNIAVSLNMPFAFLFGGGAVPAVIGFMGDVASFSHGIVLVGVLIFSGAFLAGFLKFQDKGGDHGS
jgi:NNP family nitrate/nitrite transporter-like MFS transporter